MARILEEGEAFVEGKQYRCLSLGQHTNWDFVVGDVYVADEEGLPEPTTGAQCWESYPTMQFEEVEV